MADSELTVTISGAAFSLLFYENVRSRGDQMGFFIGEVLSFVTKKVTDSETHEESVKFHVDIQSIIKCLPTDQLYEKSGKLKDDQLKELIKDREKNIVGWFRFRRNSSLNPTLRDKILHKQFMTRFRCGSDPLHENHFVGCMLNASTHSMRGTHKFRHVFLNYRHGAFHPIPLRINNLGHDATSHDTGDYKPTPIRYSEEPDAFTKFVNSLNSELNYAPGNESIDHIQRAAEQHLQRLIPAIVRSDQEVGDLERKLLEMRQMFTKKVTEMKRQGREKATTDNKHRVRRERDKQTVEQSASRVRAASLKLEESSPKSPKIQDDSYVAKTMESSGSKQKNRLHPQFENPMSTSRKANLVAMEKSHFSDEYDVDSSC